MKQANLLSSLIFSEAYVLSSCDGRLYKTLQVLRLLYLSIFLPYCLSVRFIAKFPVIIVKWVYFKVKY